MKKKKIITVVLVVILLLFLPVLVINKNDSKYIEKVKTEIKKHTEIKDISYINKYDSYYIVIDNKDIYVIDEYYKEIVKIDKNKIHKNEENYEIIYDDESLKYMNLSRNKNGITICYYDIYTYKLVDKIILDS